MTHNYFFSPHRDDAILIFGGLILSKVGKNEQVVIFNIFGYDGNLEKRFKKKLFRLKNNHPHLKRLGLNLDAVSFEDISRLGIEIRRQEEKIVAKKADYELREYDFIAGYPYRGYKKFNSPVRKKDKDKIKQLLLGKINLNKEIIRLKKFGMIEPKLSPVIKDIIDKIKTEKKSKFNLYFTAGIGGHPDHVILAEIGRDLARKDLKNVQVFFGQDLPYSVVQEWFAKSPLDFDNYQKEHMDISEFHSEKMKLLSLYASQLTKSELNLLKIYSENVYRLWKNKNVLGAAEILYVPK